MRRWLAPALLGALASPAAAQPHVPAPTVPAEDSTPPAPPSGSTSSLSSITFRDAVRAAIARNPDRLIALQEIARVDGLLAQATSALLPQISADLTYTRLEGNRYVAMKLSADANQLLASADVTTPIVDLHAYAERRRAHDRVAVTAAQAEATKRDVAIATARAYFAALSAARFLEVAEHARDTAAAHVSYATQRHTAGVGNELDVSRAATELATDESQVASALTAKLRAEEALGVITGGDRALAAFGEPDLDTSRAGTSIGRRSDIIAFDRAREAADWSRRHDWFDWVPSLRLTGDAFYSAPQVDPIPRFGYEAIFTLSLPIYDGGYRHGAHEQNQALEAEAQTREVGLEREATSEIRVSTDALGEARTARDAAHRASTSAAHTLDLANTGYKAGTATGLEVVDAQREALDAETRATIADDDYRQAQLDLLSATGAFPP